MIQLPILYKRTSNGAVQQWQIIVRDFQYYTIEGLLNGKLTESKPTIALPKNVGKANETTSKQQATIEATAKHKKKLEKGYFEDKSLIDEDRGYISPMLAKNYDDYKDTLVFPVYSQPKLDGIRCIVSRDSMKSRNGKNIVAAPHILEELQSVFDEYPNLILDGELYCDKYANDFNSIVSLVRQTKPTQEDLLKSKASIQYWIYDVVDTSKRFSDRVYLYNKLYSSSSIIHVPTLSINNNNDLDTAFYKYIEDGYEGQIIRLDTQYENKRSKSLLKRKEFCDSEYIIKGIVEGEGNRTGTAGYMCFETKDGVPFKSNIKGPHTYLSEILINKNSIVGKFATIKYFNLTPDGIPRFPYVISIRDYE